MPVTLQNFYKQLTNTGVRLSHQYLLTIDGAAVNFFEKDLLSCFVKSANIPSLSQDHTNVEFFGYSFKSLTTFKMSQNMQLTVLCDSKMKLRDAFIAWFNRYNYVFDESGGGGLGIGTGIKTPLADTGAIISLWLLDENFNFIDDSQVYFLHGVYPDKIQEIQVTTENSNVLQFSVDIGYQYWTKKFKKYGKVEQEALKKLQSKIRKDTSKETKNEFIKSSVGNYQQEQLDALAGKINGKRQVTTKSNAVDTGTQQNSTNNQSENSFKSIIANAGNQSG